jgi:hypothetical protein
VKHGLRTASHFYTNLVIENHLGEQEEDSDLVQNKRTACVPTTSQARHKKLELSPSLISRELLEPTLMLDGAGNQFAFNNSISSSFPKGSTTLDSLGCLHGEYAWPPKKVILKVGTAALSYL